MPESPNMPETKAITIYMRAEGGLRVESAVPPSATLEVLLAAAEKVRVDLFCAAYDQRKAAEQRVKLAEPGQVIPWKKP